MGDKGFDAGAEIDHGPGGCDAGLSGERGLVGKGIIMAVILAPWC
jgi:hypothetical protein